jgi:8-oxo-dGTP diphosphatase
MISPYTSYVTIDAPYLPIPNQIEIVLSPVLCAPELTRTSFLMPMLGDGSFIFAQNQRRGIEIPGGHVDPGETLLQAALRETMEETGCEVIDVVPIGFLRMMTFGEKPADWRYPYPLSYQQFFAGRLRLKYPYETNDECAQPVRVKDLRGLRPSIEIFGQRARELLMRHPYRGR